jgi:hypothetical protein
MKMSDKSEVTVCSNPKCNRTIDKIILLKDLSMDSSEQYGVCPHCFVKLEVPAQTPSKNTKVSGREIDESTPHPVVGKILDAISTQSQKIDEKAASIQPTKKGTSSPSGCQKHFGYLAKRLKNVPIPPECLTCPKTVDCMLRPNVDKSDV